MMLNTYMDAGTEVYLSLGPVSINHNGMAVKHDNLEQWPKTPCVACIVT